ncbi:MAG: hypothetical protein OD918_08150 [Gammaproteobacteria bacterium]
MSKTPILSQHELLVDCERSMLYHEARTRFYNRWQLFVQFLVIAFSTTGVPVLLDVATQSTTPWLVPVMAWLMTAIGVLTVFNLVYDPAGQAHRHQLLAGAFTKLEGGIAAVLDAEPAALAGWTRELYALYAKEPPIYFALGAFCANQIVIARAADSDYLIDLRWWHLRLRNVISFSGTEFQNRRQMRQHPASREVPAQKPAAQPA